MKIDANVVLYLLKREFDGVDGWISSRSSLVDYPILFDDQADMDGHVVLMPAGTTSVAGVNMRNAVCVCVDDAAVAACRGAGLQTIAVKGVRSLSSLYNGMQAVFVRNERLDMQLRAAVDTFAGFQPLLDACAHTMGCSCALVDDRYRLVCSAEGSMLDGVGVKEHPSEFVDEDLVDLFMASRDYRYMRASRKVFAVPGSANLFMKNVFVGENLVGMLAMAHAGDVHSARYVHFLLDYLAGFVEEAYERIGSFGTTSAEAKQIGDALERAIDGEVVDFANLDRMLFAERGDEAGSFVLLRLERSFTHEGAGELDYLARRVEMSWPYAHCVVRGGALFALVNLDAASHKVFASRLQNVVTFARETLAKVGVSRSFESSARIPAARIQATAALEQGNVANPTRWVHRFEEHALSWLLEHGRENIPASYVMHPAIETLARYDEEHGTDLTRTLHVFMQCRYNATEAANRLFVARSTLLNRLVRIDELTHVDLEDLKERIYLGLSLEMLA